MTRCMWTRAHEDADKILESSSFKAEQIICASIHEIHSSVTQKLGTKTSNNIIQCTKRGEVGR